MKSLTDLLIRDLHHELTIRKITFNRYSRKADLQKLLNAYFLDNKVEDVSSLDFSQKTDFFQFESMSDEIDKDAVNTENKAKEVSIENNKTPRTRKRRLEEQKNDETPSDEGKDQSVLDLLVSDELNETVRIMGSKNSKPKNEKVEDLESFKKRRKIEYPDDTTENVVKIDLTDEIGPVSQTVDQKGQEPVKSKAKEIKNESEAEEQNEAESKVIELAVESEKEANPAESKGEEKTLDGETESNGKANVVESKEEEKSVENNADGKRVESELENQKADSEAIKNSSESTEEENPVSSKNEEKTVDEEAQNELKIAENSVQVAEVILDSPSENVGETKIADACVAGNLEIEKKAVSDVTIKEPTENMVECIKIEQIELPESETSVSETVELDSAEPNPDNIIIGKVNPQDTEIEKAEVENIDDKNEAAPEGPPEKYESIEPTDEVVGTDNISNKRDDLIETPSDYEGASESDSEEPETKKLKIEKAEVIISNNDIKTQEPDTVRKLVPRKRVNVYIDNDRFENKEQNERLTFTTEKGKSVEIQNPLDPTIFAAMKDQEVVEDIKRKNNYADKQKRKFEMPMDSGIHLVKQKRLKDVNKKNISAKNFRDEMLNRHHRVSKDQRKRNLEKMQFSKNKTTKTYFS